VVRVSLLKGVPPGSGGGTFQSEAKSGRERREMSGELRQSRPPDPKIKGGPNCGAHETEVAYVLSDKFTVRGKYLHRAHSQHQRKRACLRQLNTKQAEIFILFLVHQAP